MDKGFEYVIKNKGIDTESSYPYTAVTGKVCKYKPANIGATISSFKDIPTNSEAVNNSRVSTKAGKLHIIEEYEKLPYFVDILSFIV